jgi:hypothetical protein
MSTGNTPPEQPYDPNQPRIADPCPSCGGSTLFIGAGGWLTCSLIGCRQPVMFDAIAVVRREEREACAKVCDDMSGWRDWAALKHPSFPGAPCEAGAAADYLAAAIRAMNEKEGK